jgi:hypothetical protein
MVPRAIALLWGVLDDFSSRSELTKRLEFGRNFGDHIFSMGCVSGPNLEEIYLGIAENGPFG